MPPLSIGAFDRSQPPFAPKPPHPYLIDPTDESYQGFLQFGGWDDAAKTLTPIRFGSIVEMDPDNATLGAEWACNCIALACEQGYLEASVFPSAAFASHEDFLSFAETLADLSDFWVNARYFWAFFELLGSEEAAVSFQSISEALLDTYGDED